MQMVSEVGIEHNTTTIVLMPSEFVTLAGDLAIALQAGREGDKRSTDTEAAV